MSGIHEEFVLEESPKPASGEEVRAAMPASAAIKDMFIDLFGPDVRVVRAEENGQVIQAKNYVSDSAFTFSLNAGQLIRIRQQAAATGLAKETQGKGNGRK